MDKVTHKSIYNQQAYFKVKSLNIELYIPLVYMYQEL